MNRKGFTLAELLGVIIIIAILSTVAVLSVNYVVQNGKKGVYQNLENTLKGAVENYLIDNSSKVPNIGGNKNITYESKNYFECSADHLGIFTAGTEDVNDDETEIINKNNKSKNVKIILISLGIVLVLTIIISLLLEWRKKKRINSGRISDFGELML